MARSFIDPSLVALATQPAAPPWNWNPGATFVEAYNESQRNQMMREKLEIDRELNQLLLPYKQQQAALDLERLAGTIQLNTASVGLTRAQEQRQRALALQALNNVRTNRQGVINIETGEIEEVEGNDNPLIDDSWGGDYDEPLPPVSRSGASEPPLPGGPNMDPNLDIDPEMVPPMSDDEDVPDVDLSRGSKTGNPLLDDDYFGNIANSGREMMPKATEGFDNPNVVIDKDRLVPVGAQYTGGETDMASGKFESSLASEEPTSNLGESDRSFLENAMSGVEEPAEIDIAQKIAERRSQIERNIYEAERRGVTVSRDQIDRAFAKLDQEARAALIPRLPDLTRGLSEDQASFVANIFKDNKQPFETSYQMAEQFAKSARAQTPSTAGSVAADSPQLKAAVDNYRTFMSTVPEGEPLNVEQEAIKSSMERELARLKQIPEQNALSSVLTSQSEAEAMEEAKRNQRPYARKTRTGQFEVLTPDLLDDEIQKARTTATALIPLIRQERDPRVVFPDDYKTKEEFYAAKEKALAEDPDKLVFTTNGQLGLLRNFNEDAPKQTTPAAENNPFRGAKDTISNKRKKQDDAILARRLPTEIKVLERNLEDLKIATPTSWNAAYLERKFDEITAEIQAKRKQLSELQNAGVGE